MPIREGDATQRPMRPCEYCGTMLDDDGQEESNIAAAGPMISHFTSTCRERVFSALRCVQRENAELRAKLAAHPASSGSGVR
jgi:hypothetical protein